MSEIEVRRLVEAGIKRAGSLRKYAKEMGINASYVSDMVNGRRNPGPKILGPLGLKRVVAVEYVPADDDEPGADDGSPGEPTGSCEDCGVNLYAGDDDETIDGEYLCDQCYWARSQ